MKFPLKIPVQYEHRLASDSSQNNFSIMPHAEKKQTYIDKLFGGPLITLVAASSATASGSSVASASASLGDRSRAQPVLS